MAKKFKLAALLRVRRILENKKKREFGVVLGEWVAATREHERLNDEMEATHRSFQEHAVGGVSIDDLRLRETYLMALRRKVLLQEIVVLQAAQKRDRVRDELLEATRSKRVVEKLHEKFAVKARYEANKMAEKQLAETALSRYVRLAADRK